MLGADAHEQAFRAEAIKCAEHISKRGHQEITSYPTWIGVLFQTAAIHNRT